MLILDVEDRLEESRWIHRIGLGAHPGEHVQKHLQENAIEIERLLDRTPQTESELEEAREKFAAEAEAAASKYWEALKKGEPIGN